jgi:hypothetical protein
MRRLMNEEVLYAVDQLRSVASDVGLSLSQLAFSVHHND